MLAPAVNADRGMIIIGACNKLTLHRNTMIKHFKLLPENHLAIVKFLPYTVKQLGTILENKFPKVEENIRKFIALGTKASGDARTAIKLTDSASQEGKLPKSMRKPLGVKSKRPIDRTILHILAVHEGISISACITMYYSYEVVNGNLNITEEGITAVMMNSIQRLSNSGTIKPLSSWDLKERKGILRLSKAENIPFHRECNLDRCAACNL